MPKALRVLFVEDSEDDMFFEVQTLKAADFAPEFERVETLAGLTDALGRHVWDVVISDHSMPGFSSAEALEFIKRRQLDIPFIIVSGVIGEEAAVSAMKSGASDYVMKNSLARLAPSIERELREAANRRERAQAEKELRRSQYELNDFFQNAPVGLLWTGADGAILRVNRTARRLLGCDEPQIQGHHVSEFFAHPAAAAEAIGRLQDGKSLKDFDAQVRCQDGTLKDVRINANTQWDDGRFICSRWFMSDVTERLQHEQAVAFLGAIVEGSEDAIIGTDLDGVIASWNAGAARLYGYTLDEAVGQSIQTLLPGSCLGGPMEVCTQLLAGMQGDRHESTRIKKGGQTVPVSFTLSPIKNKDGVIIGFSVIERDITARLREEEERLALIQELSDALANIKTLRGMLPICASCKKIRDDNGYWNRIESYISEHSQAEFTHGLCPDCQELIEAHDTLKL